jgi:hypothetical protein
MMRLCHEPFRLPTFQPLCQLSARLLLHLLVDVLLRVEISSISSTTVFVTMGRRKVGAVALVNVPFAASGLQLIYIDTSAVP